MIRELAHRARYFLARQDTQDLSGCVGERAHLKDAARAAWTLIVKGGKSLIYATGRARKRSTKPAFYDLRDSEPLRCERICPSLRKCVRCFETGVSGGAGHAEERQITLPTRANGVFGVREVHPAGELCS
jgi:hypothetical protein